MKLKSIALAQIQKLWRKTETKAARRVFRIMASLAILFVGVPVGLDAAGHMAYRSKDYETAQKMWRLNQVVAWHDKDVSRTNAGLSYYKQDRLTPAVDQLEGALKLAKSARECRIRWNLAVVLAARASQRTVDQPNEAVGDYSRAINVLASQKCLEDPSYKDSFMRLSEDLNNKMQALIKQIADQHARPADDSEKDTKPTSEEERTKAQNQQQIEYQNDLNYQRYSQQPEEERYSSDGENAW